MRQKLDEMTEVATNLMFEMLPQPCDGGDHSALDQQLGCQTCEDALHACKARLELSKRPGLGLSYERTEILQKVILKGDRW